MASLLFRYASVHRCLLVDALSHAVLNMYSCGLWLCE